MLSFRQSRGERLAPRSSPLFFGEPRGTPLKLHSSVGVVREMRLLVFLPPRALLFQNITRAGGKKKVRLFFLPFPFFLVKFNASGTSFFGLLRCVPPLLSLPPEHGKEAFFPFSRSRPADPTFFFFFSFFLNK